MCGTYLVHWCRGSRGSRRGCRGGGYDALRRACGHAHGDTNGLLKAGGGGDGWNQRMMVWLCYLVLDRGRGGCGSGGSGSDLDALRSAGGHASRDTGGLLRGEKGEGGCTTGFNIGRSSKGCNQEGVVPGRRERGWSRLRTEADRRAGRRGHTGGSARVG